jgi:aminoglycoside phosphotransferase family enzyme
MKDLHISFLKKALLNPAVYPDHPDEIQFGETHISLLFFTGKHVYKLKKPMNFGFLDFTTLEKRKYFCEQEVTLNLRLSPKIYLGVVAVTEDGGQISFNGKGKTIEYAVWMKQIPEDLLMDKLLHKGEVSPEMIQKVSEKLARFYSTADTNEIIKSFAKPGRIKQDTDENFEQTEKYIDRAIPKEVYAWIKDRTNRFLQEQVKLFERRIVEGRIRDCHGDLRLEHIFWGDEISIFDCIEFNERFRYTDVAADIAFLAMDIDYRGREDLTFHLINTYIDRSGDHDLPEILDFYKCYRAYVRGKVESFRLDDPNIPEEEKREALRRAQKYFVLAHRYSLKF